MGALINLFQDPTPDLQADRWEQKDLDTRVLQHLKSLRLKSGEELFFLNGRGLKTRVRMDATDSKHWSFEVLERIQVPMKQPQIHLWLAPPSGDLLSTCIAQATEIGVTRLNFLQTQYCQYSKKQEPPVGRAEKVMWAALEQCGRAWAVDLNPQWCTLSDAFKNPNVIVADEDLAQSGQIGFSNGIFPAQDIYHLCVGPEGGWSNQERDLFLKQGLTLSLGSHILRVPTALTAACFFLRLCWQHRSS